MSREDTTFPFVILLIGAGAVSLNANLLKVALPFFMEEFQVDTTRLTWITISYSFFKAVFTPVLGKLGDTWEHKRIALGGYLFLIVGSVLGGTARSFYGLLLGRCIQGIGAGAVIPNTLIAAPALFPPQRRGWAMGLLVSTGSSAAFIGPALGGLLMEYIGWRSLFLLNIPIMLVVFALTLSGAKKTKGSASPSPMDTEFKRSTGLSLVMGSWIILLNLGVFYGWESTFFLLAAGIVLCLSIYFFLLEQKYENHFIDFHLLTNRVFRTGFISGLFEFTIKYCLSFVLPLLLSIEYGQSPGQIGFLLVLVNIARLIIAPLSGSFSDRYGCRLPLQVGFAILLLALGLLYSPMRELFSGFLYISMVLVGAGSGLVSTPAVTSVRENTPYDSQGTIIGFFFSFRYIIGMVGQIILGLLLQPLQKDMIVEQSSPLFNRAFGFILLFALLGYLFSRSIPKGKQIVKGKIQA